MNALLLAATLFLHTGDKTVRVDTKEPARQVLLRNGEKAVAWSPEDAARIVDALTRAGAPEAIPAALGGLKIEAQETSCLTLETDHGQLYTEIPGTVQTDTAGRIVWTEAQIRAIQTQLAARGLEADLPGIFALSYEDEPINPGFGDGPTPFRGHAAHPGQTSPGLSSGPVDASVKPLPLPDCGKCLTGILCSVKGQWQCCTGSGTCSTCRVCSSPQ